MALYEAQYVGSRILAWENYTSTATPLSAGNLNKIQATLEGIDTNAGNAINLLDQTKADKETVNGLVNSVQFNDQTGVFTFGQVGGTSITINTVLEKVPASFAYDTQTEKLVIVNTDGTTVQVDLSTVIQQTEFVDSDTIAWTINADGTMSATVKDGSITDAKIQQHYLALVTAQANAAHTSETNADYYAKLSKSYANGTSNLEDRPTENVDNSYYYSQQSKTSSEDSEAWAVGTRNGANVPSTDPAYENNAEYWAHVSEQMSGSAVFIGATDQNNGVRGLVPGPLIADRNKVLRGDGTWGESEGTQQLQNDLTTTQDNIADVEVSPAVAAHAVDEQIIYNNVLYTVMSAISIGDELVVNTNIVESERIVEQLKPFTGATSQNAGDIGTVPAPSVGDEDKVLQGDGSWGKKLQIDVVIQNNQYGYIGANNTFIPFKSQADIDAAVSAAKVGTAVAADVLAGKTFTNSTTSGVSGSMVNRSTSTIYQHSSSNTTPHLAGDAVYFTKRYNKSTQADDQNVIGVRYDGGAGYIQDNTLVSYPATAFGDAAVDNVLSGKKFTSQNGLELTGTMPSRSNGEAAVSTDRANGIRVFFPRGHYPNYATHDGQSYVTLTDAQVVNFANKAGIYITASTSDQTVYPSEGKLFSYVTVGPTPTQQKTTKPTTRSTTAATITPDSGKYLSQVTVDTTSVPNSNSSTYTYSSGSTGGQVDLGEANTYRYVNAVNVYSKGKLDAVSSLSYASSSQSGKVMTITTTNGSYYLAWIGAPTYTTYSISGGSVVASARDGGNYFMMVKATSTSVKITNNGSNITLSFACKFNNVY